MGLRCLMRSFGYGDMSHRTWVKRPGGTINFSLFDDRGLVTSVYVGTNATGATQDDPTGGGAAGNNMVLVTQNEYDNGVAGRDGNLTSTWAWVDGSTNRQTQIAYDFRNRQSSVTGEENSYSDTTYDNLNRPLVRQTRNGSAAATLLSKSQTDYDNRGRVVRTTNWAVDPNTGVIGVPLCRYSTSRISGVPCPLTLDRFRIRLGNAPCVSKPTRIRWSSRPCLPGGRYWNNCVRWGRWGR